MPKQNHGAPAPAPDVEFLPRAGGEKRFGDFLPCESADTELLFLDSFWPDFDEQALDHALNEFALRDHRYGRVGWRRVASLSHA